MERDGYEKARSHLSVLVEDYWKLKRKHTSDGRKLDQIYVTIVNMAKDLNDLNSQHHIEKEKNQLFNVKREKFD